MKEMHEFEEKYMQNEAFWEFEALSIFLGVNPFEYAYQYINVDYDEAAPDTNVTIVGIIANVQKKKDRTGKTVRFFEYVLCVWFDGGCLLAYTIQTE